MTTSMSSSRASRSTTNAATDKSVMDNSDTMAQLNLMISKFESLSQSQNIQKKSKGHRNDNSRNRLVYDLISRLSQFLTFQ